MSYSLQAALDLLADVVKQARDHLEAYRDTTNTTPEIRRATNRVF